MKCPQCDTTLRKVMVSVAGASSKAASYPCPSCDYFSFEKESSSRVLEELHATPLKIRQKIVRLSGDRLGMYFNKHVVESLGLKKGGEVLVSVPDKKTVIIEVK